METLPQVGTKVKIIGVSVPSFQKIFPMFIEKKNEWEVVDTNVKSQNCETLVTIRNLKGVMSNQTMVFFKEELEQI